MTFWKKRKDDDSGQGETPEQRQIIEQGKADTVIKKTWYRDWGEAIVVAFIVAMILRTFVVQAFKIPSGSMEDTLLIGDHLLVNKFIYGTTVPFTDSRFFSIREPERGDVIVFEFPDDEGKSYFKRRDFIKRVVGVPGDRVKMVNKTIYVNDKPFVIPQESYKGAEQSYNPVLRNFNEITVPEESYFVLGDNRDRSLDSRFWGYVPMKKIKGLAFIKYWSWDREKFLPRLGRIGRLIE